MAAAPVTCFFRASVEKSRPNDSASRSIASPASPVSWAGADAASVDAAGVTDPAPDTAFASPWPPASGVRTQDPRRTRNARGTTVRLFVTATSFPIHSYQRACAPHRTVARAVPHRSGCDYESVRSESAREAIDPAGPAARCRVRAVLVRVRRVPRGQRPGGVAVRAEAVGVANLREQRRGIGRPVGTGG